MRALILSLLFILGSAVAQEVAPLPTDWYLRMRVVNQDGVPLKGVQIWQNIPLEMQVSAESFPDWKEISERKKGLAESEFINFTAPLKTVSKDDGTLLVGPLRAPVGFYGKLYHPITDTLDFHVDGNKQKPNAQGVVDLGDIVLPKGNTVRGRVLGLDGKAVKDAWVAARAVRSWPAIENDKLKIQRSFSLAVGLVRAARTDAEGRYEITGLANCPFHIGAWTDSDTPVVGEVDFLKSVPPLFDTREVNLQFKKGETVSVVAVEGEEKKPLANAWVTASIESSHNPSVDRGIKTVFEGRTGPDGKVEISGLPADSKYQIWVTGPGGRWCSLATEPNSTETAHFLHTNLKLKLQGADGKEIEGYRYQLECTHAGADSPSSWARGIHSNRRSGGLTWVEGNKPLELDKLSYGNWKLAVFVKGYATESLVFQLDGKGFDRTLVLTPVSGTLKGRVVDVDGRPLVNIKLLASNEYQGPVWGNPRLFTAYEITTAADGSFEVRGLLGEGAQRYLSADLPGYVPLEESWKAKANDEAIADVTLIRAGSLKGKLVSGGVAAPNAEVGLWNSRGRDGLEVTGLKADYHGTERCDAKGEWVRERLKPGKYLLAAGAGTKIVEVKPGEEADAGALEIDRVK